MADERTKRAERTTEEALAWVEAVRPRKTRKQMETPPEGRLGGVSYDRYFDL